MKAETTSCTHSDEPRKGRNKSLRLSGQLEGDHRLDLLLLPFLPLMEEKEAKEDQGDDRLQVGRMGAGSYLGLYGVLPNICRDMFRLSWGSSE